MHIDIELSGKLTRGMTVCDYRHLCGANPTCDIERESQVGYQGRQPNAEAALELGYEGYLKLVYDTLTQYQ